MVKAYRCPCDKVYKTVYGLKNHMKVCIVANRLPPFPDIEVLSFEMPAGSEIQTGKSSGKSINAGQANTSAKAGGSSGTKPTPEPEPVEPAKNGGVLSGFVKLHDELGASSPAQIGEQVIIESAGPFTLVDPKQQQLQQQQPPLMQQTPQQPQPPAQQQPHSPMDTTVVKQEPGSPSMPAPAQQQHHPIPVDCML